VWNEGGGELGMEIMLGAPAEESEVGTPEL